MRRCPSSSKAQNSRTASITASGTPVVLTVSSAQQNFVSGSGGQVIQLPNATTLTVGTAFRFDNNQSSGAITVNNNSGTLVVSVPSGGFVVVTLLSNGTTAGTWDRHDLAPANVSWSTNTFDYPGSITSATWNGVTVATNRGGTGLASFTSGGAVYATSTSALTTGTLPTASGGTNLTSFTSGGAVYATSTSVLTTGTLPLTAGGTGQTTKAAAFNALSPVTSTGDLIIGNGTNSNTRLGIGANTYVLTSDGSTASWQPAAGGGGGVTSFDGGFTGLSPYSPTTGAVSLGGTLGVNYGGTGTGTTPSSGQLLIGTSFSSYQVANLTAGTGISITNSSGAITIAATGGGGPTISVLSVSTSSGSFNNSPPSSSYSQPLIGNTISGPTNYGAFFFQNNSTGFSVSGTSVNSMVVLSSTGTSTSYTSGGDFSGMVYVYDAVVVCYGMFLYNAALKTLFADSKTSITSPSVAPLDAQSSFGFTNPGIAVSTSGSPYGNGSGSRGVTVNKFGPNFNLAFGSNDFTSASPSVNSIGFSINGSSATYFSGSDFSVLAANNSSNGMFIMQISSFNATLTTLLTNSFKGI